MNLKALFIEIKNIEIDTVPAPEFIPISESIADWNLRRGLLTLQTHRVSKKVAINNIGLKINKLKVLNELRNLF